MTVDEKTLLQGMLEAIRDNEKQLGLLAQTLAVLANDVKNSHERFCCETTDLKKRVERLEEKTDMNATLIYKAEHGVIKNITAWIQWGFMALLAFFQFVKWGTK